MNVTQSSKTELEINEKINENKTKKTYILIDSLKGAQLIKDNNIFINENFGEKSDSEILIDLYNIKINKIKVEAQKLAETIINKYPRVERDSWPDLAEQSKNGSGELLDSLVVGFTAEQKTDFIANVMAKDIEYRLVRAAIVRQRIIYSAQLELIKDDVDAMNAFVIDYKLP